METSKQIRCVWCLHHLNVEREREKCFVVLLVVMKTKRYSNVEIAYPLFIAPKNAKPLIGRHTN